MKKNILLPLLALATLTISACHGGERSQSGGDKPAEYDPSAVDGSSWSDDIKADLKDHLYSYNLPYFLADDLGTVQGGWDEDYLSLIFEGGNLTDKAPLERVSKVFNDDGFVDLSALYRVTDDEVYYAFEKAINVKDVGERFINVQFGTYVESTNSYELPGNFFLYASDPYLYSWTEAKEALDGILALFEMTIDIPSVSGNRYSFDASGLFEGYFSIASYGLAETYVEEYKTSLGEGWTIEAKEEDGLSYYTAIPASNDYELDFYFTDGVFVVDIYLSFEDDPSGGGDDPGTDPGTDPSVDPGDDPSGEEVDPTSTGGVVQSVLNMEFDWNPDTDDFGDKYYYADVDLGTEKTPEEACKYIYNLLAAAEGFTGTTEPAVDEEDEDLAWYADLDYLDKGAYVYFYVWEEDNTVILEIGVSDIGESSQPTVEPEVVIDGDYTTVTLTPENFPEATSEEFSCEYEGLTVTVSNGSVTEEDVRIFKGQTIEISAEEVVSIEFTCTKEGTTKYGPGGFKSIEGYSYSGKVGTWTGSAESVQLLAETNQVRITELVVKFK